MRKVEKLAGNLHGKKRVRCAHKNFKANSKSGVSMKITEWNQ